MPHEFTTVARFPLADGEQCARPIDQLIASKAGLLLVGHGSREAAAIKEFHAATRLIASAARETPVEASFLEFAEPTIAEGFENLVRRGVRCVVVAPLLLFRAGHAERDIPHAVTTAAAQHRDVALAWAEHLGCHPAILELSRKRYEQALSRLDPIGAEQTALVMVGRGSRSEAATAEMREFVALRRQATPVAHALAGFLSMARPALEPALEHAVLSGAKRIVVQPHLLFAGTLADRVAQTVAGFSERFVDKDWLVTEHLGPSELLADAILERAAAAHDQPGSRQRISCRDATRLEARN